MNMELSKIAITAVSFLIMLFGLVGIIFPFFPGIILIWTGVFLYAGITQFQVITVNNIFMVTLLVFAALLLDYVSGYWGTKKFNASIWGITGALIGALVGSVFGWFFALFIGPFAGAIVGEVFSGRDEMFKIEFKTYKIIGFVGGTLAKMTVAVAIIGLFVYKVLQQF